MKKRKEKEKSPCALDNLGTYFCLGLRVKLINSITFTTEINTKKLHLEMTKQYLDNFFKKKLDKIFVSLDYSIGHQSPAEKIALFL